MKRVTFFILIFTSLLTAQTTIVDSSLAVLSRDSILVSDLVQEQINKAKAKQSEQIPAASNNFIEKRVNVQTIRETVSYENKLVWFFANQPLQIKIFSALVLIILFALIFRRTILHFKRRAARALKKKIEMLRSEKVVSKNNPKLQIVRKKLRSNKLIFDPSEKQISRTAKEMNVAKGELLLAARLKLFEIGKM